MANKILWDAAAASGGTVLTTELDSLANNAFSAAGTEIDNTAGLATRACLEIVLASLDPAAGGFLRLFMIQAPGGTNYEDAPSANQAGDHNLVAVVDVDVSSSAKRITTPWFDLPPTKVKFVLQNVTGVSFAASSNTVTIYTASLEVQ